ncbi:hypothetical protein RAH32_16970 [Paracoccus sp. WLY502]|nr:hypothetical protein [Paracoccus sp. WLY502]MDQ1902123.1 hypothetical protein [Paracoccus sp. WLY502]
MARADDQTVFEMGVPAVAVVDCVAQGARGGNRAGVFPEQMAGIQVHADLRIDLAL